MPEGPEVKRITDVLNKRLQGKMLNHVGINQKSRYNGKLMGGIGSIPTPALIKGVVSKGKKVVFILKVQSSLVYVVSSLGMEGHWQFEEGKHSGIQFDIGHDRGRFRIREDRVWYDDSRHFGTFYIYDQNTIKELNKKVGPDFLNGEVTLPIYLAKVRKTKQTIQICEFMMEQKYFSGVGNYLKAEILYASKIAPDRELSSLSDQDIEALFTSTMKILSDSYNNGGHTLSSYSDPDGVQGTYEVVVYNKSVDPLGNPIEKVTLSDKRVTHWVPAVQV